MVNRTQALVLGFFVLAVTSLLVILVVAPEVYDQALKLPTGNHQLEAAFLAALLSFITLLGIGVLRRWRLGGVVTRVSRARSAQDREPVLPPLHRSGPAVGAAPSTTASGLPQ